MNSNVLGRSYVPFSCFTLSCARSACSMLILTPLQSLILELNSPEVSFERGLRAAVGWGAVERIAAVVEYWRGYRAVLLLLSVGCRSVMRVYNKSAV